MALIEVNYQALRDLATRIDEYCDTQTAEMKQLDGQVKAMLTDGWTGPDAMAFGGTWEGVDESGSTADNFRKSLENYSEALRACASTYQTAQENIYNIASLLK